MRIFDCSLALYIHEDISWYLDESDDKRTKGDRSNVVENQVADRLPNGTIKRVLVSEIQKHTTPFR